MTRTRISDKSVFPFIKKYRTKFLFVLMLLLLLFYGLFWLAVGILCLAALYKLILYGIGSIRIQWFRKLAKGLFLFLFVFMVSIGLKLLVVDVYGIPSSSMENTLFPKDVIMVNKLAYGPKLPRSPFEISWVNLLFYMNDMARASIEETWWPYRRLSGIKKIQQGDVLVYQLNRTYFVVKRCVAIAGDTLMIRKGEVYVNSEKYNSPNTVKNIYRLKVSNRGEFYKQMDSLGIQGSLYSHSNNYGYLQGILSYEERDRIKTFPEVKTIEKVLDTFDLKKGLFFMLPDKRWNLDHMGPLIIPKTGMKIHLDQLTYNLYQKVLEQHEGVKLSEANDWYYIDNKKSEYYTFKKDYFFVMGDSRKSSMDSRYVGFIPEENIIGKAQYVMFSNYRGKFRWDRFFKGILR